MAILNKDGFFDEALSIQKLPSDLEAVFNEAGWETTANFKVWSPVRGDNYRKKFGEVKLFSSLGSDNVRRNFGYISGYGGKVTQKGEEPIISRSSSLGELLEVEDSAGTEFKFEVYPVVVNSAILYKEDGTIIDEEEYVIDHENGLVTFDVSQNSRIYSTYALTDNAPGMVDRLWFFTFEDFRPERTVYADEGLRESVLEENEDGTYSFNYSGSGKVKESSIAIYDEEGSEIPSELYTYDYNENVLTFSPDVTDVPQEVTADYTIVIQPDGVDFGEIETIDFSPNDPEGLASALYSSIRFIFPSIPTAVSFIPTDEYGLGWGRGSQIYAWGNVTKDRIVAYFRVDPAPAPEQTYFTPLYIGKLSTIGKSPKLNNVLIGGAREEDEIVYEHGLKLGRQILDYGTNTTNGNSGVMLQQTIGGAMYQKHYLSFITHDVGIDSSNEARFNPSVYSDKYHISPMYIVHPSDGYVGRLDEVYAIHPKNIKELEELEVIEESKNEHIGVGDGENTLFHFFHKPLLDEDFKIQLVSDDGCVEYDAESEEITINSENGVKNVTFNEAPGDRVEVIATYNYSQVYRYTLADTPITPFLLSNMSPYAPIGLGFLKENI